LGEEDLDQVLEIERASFACPWKREHFLHEIRENRWAVNLAVRRRGDLLAYACTWVLYEELKINNIAVRADHRRQGLGRWLLQRILDDARRQGCTIARLEVRPSNTAAILLYERVGFAKVGRRKGYYQSEGEDAVVMEMEL
jgi:ribosomal-protein-alanine N-acetyltransferase